MVPRRYSDFVWLLEVLHRRYPFRLLPNLPPKRVAVNGYHFVADEGFLERRRRGLQRFLEKVVNHPVLGSDGVVNTFMTEQSVRSRLRSRSKCSTKIFARSDFQVETGPHDLEEAPSSILRRRIDLTPSVPVGRDVYSV